MQAYLGFMGTLQGLSPARLAARIAAVVEECQLGGVTAQVIRTLSLGFRQRVSLAQARLHLDRPYRFYPGLEFFLWQAEEV